MRLKYKSKYHVLCASVNGLSDSQVGTLWGNCGNLTKTLRPGPKMISLIFLCLYFLWTSVHFGNVNYL